MKFWYGGKDGCRFKLTVSPAGYGVFAERKGETAAAEGVFCSRKEAHDFVRLCARAQLEPCHLRDAAEDRLAEIK